MIPPESGYFPELLNEIRVAAPRSFFSGESDLAFLNQDDHATSAIRMNQSGKTIVDVAYSWVCEPGGLNSTPGANASVLLPFQLHERATSFQYFWNAIFSGSKRLLTADGGWFGNNTDVRQPVGEEDTTACFGTAFGRLDGKRSPSRLTLDGVFFEDGAFGGPNHLGWSEQITFSAEAHLAGGQTSPRGEFARRVPFPAANSDRSA